MSSNWGDQSRAGKTEKRAAVPPFRKALSGLAAWARLAPGAYRCEPPD